jgi:hypothetical protein
MPTKERRGPGDRQSLSAGARRLSVEHVSRLRALVARVGSVHALFPLLKTTPDAVADALTFGIFRAKRAEEIEARIDELHSGLEQGELPPRVGTARRVGGEGRAPG